jgi:hypothetical protein
VGQCPQYSLPIPARAPAAVRSLSAQRHNARRKGLPQMKTFKFQAFRVLLVLSAIASSALVLEAGQRWK